MKTVKAYEDSSGNLHKTKEGWAKNELFLLLNRKLQNDDLYQIVDKRKDVIAILQELDNLVEFESVTNPGGGHTVNYIVPSNSCDARPMAKALPQDEVIGRDITQGDT